MAEYQSQMSLIKEKALHELGIGSEAIEHIYSTYDYPYYLPDWRQYHREQSLWKHLFYPELFPGVDPVTASQQKKRELAAETPNIIGVPSSKPKDIKDSTTKPLEDHNNDPKTELREDERVKREVKEESLDLEAPLLEIPNEVKAIKSQDIDQLRDKNKKLMRLKHELKALRSSIGQVVDEMLDIIGDQEEVDGGSESV